MSTKDHHKPEYVDPANQPGACSRSRAAAGSRFDDEFRFDCAMMLPFAVIGFICQKIGKWTIGGFCIGWEIARVHSGDDSENTKDCGGESRSQL